MTAHKIDTPLKTHGGKRYLADRILSLFPPRDSYRTYVEPFLGGGSVLLQHDPDGKSEIVGDVNLNLTNFWRVLRDPPRFEVLRQRLHGTPFSEIEFVSALKMMSSADTATDPMYDIERAACFFIVARQSMSGRGDCFTPVSTTRLRRNMNEQVSSWWGAIDGLKDVADRMSRVLIHEGPAIKLIKKYDKPGVVIYLDPPYLQVDSDGRKVRASPDVYDHEMTTEQHVELLKVVTGVKFARVLLSGYPSKLYDEHLQGWTVTKFTIDNKASKKAVKDMKEEIVWTNYKPPQAPGSPAEKSSES